MIFLDTNIVIFLYAGKKNFSAEVQDALNDNDCFISPMVRLELQYLYEIGRSKHNSSVIIEALYQDIGLTVHNHAFDSIMLSAIDAKWTRDPFDRIIVAHAKCLDQFLISSDAMIKKHYKKCLW